MRLPQRNTQSKLFLLDRGADRLAESLVANATRFSSPAILALDGPTQLGMRRTVRRLEAVGEKPTALLASLSTGIIHLRMSRRHLVEEASWPYWNCEIRKHDEETGACVVLPAGEEMAVCARVSPSLSLLPGRSALTSSYLFLTVPLGPLLFTRSVILSH